MTAADYSPQAGGLPARVIAFFDANPEEELTLDDIASKFDTVLHLLIIMQEASDTETHTYGGRVPNEGLMLVAGNVFGKQLGDVIKEIQGEIKAKIWPKTVKKAPPPNAPLAQPKNAGGDKSKGVKGSKAPAKNSPAARAKLSAEDALSGIATAMQGVDRAASAPDGAVAPPEATNADTQLVPVEAWPFPGTDTAKALAAKRQELGISVPMGQRVKVVLGKYKGKEGTVKKDMGSDIYLVKIDRVSVASSMSRGYFELVEAAAA